MKTLLLIDARQHNVDIVKRIHNCGIRVVFVQKPGRFIDPLQGEAAECVVLTEYEAEEFIELANRLHEHWNFDAVLALGEESVEIAARLNEEWGIHSTPMKVAQLLKDKISMREHLQRSRFSTVPFAICRSAYDLKQFADQHRFPIILKPIDGDGSKNVYKINSFSDIEPIMSKYLVKRPEAIAESWIEGDEYSVEAFSVSGDHTIIAVTETEANEDFVETGHIVPARIKSDVHLEIEEFVTRFLTVIGITDGPSHTEIKVGVNGIKVIESHNRIAGGNIELLVNHVYGIDMSSISAKWACKIETPKLTKLEPSGCAVSQFFVFNPGKIQAISGTDKLVEEAGDRLMELKYLFKPGDTIPSDPSGFSRVGYFVLKGTDQDETWNTSLNLLKCVSIKYET